MIPLIPYSISFLIGLSLINCILRKNESADIHPFAKLFLAFGLGISLTVNILFYSLILFGQLNQSAVILLETAFLVIIIIIQIFLYRKNKLALVNLKKINLGDWAVFLFFALSLLGLGHYATIFQPQGGWDAWQVWNLKAKFIYLGNEHWTNVFHPLLWRSSPHYPLFLPLINVWVWIFTGNPSERVPLLTSLIFIFITAGLLYSSLLNKTPRIPALLGVLLFLTSPFWIILSTSQYCDIVIGYYLLASIVCLVTALQTRQKRFFLLAGLFLGSLTFTKPEGLTAAVLILILTVIYSAKDKLLSKKDFRKIIFLLTGFGATALPALLFQLLYGTQNLTFINGLTSAAHPSSFLRLKVILAFFFFELISLKWNGIWIVLILGCLLGIKRAFHRQFILIPLFLLIYLGIVIGYYFVNTHFPILGWMKDTLNRILFALLPVIVYWICCSIYGEKKNL